MSVRVENRYGPGPYVLVWTDDDAERLGMHYDYAADDEEARDIAPPKPAPTFRLHRDDVPALVFALLQGPPGTPGPMGPMGASA